MSVALIQDIHLSDEELWKAFQKYWGENNYVAAINLLNRNQQLATKYVSAEWINSLTALVYQLELNEDPDLKKNKIKISYLPPALEVGQIYFQIQIGEINVDVAIGTIDVNSTSTTVNYSDKLIGVITLQDLKIVKTNLVMNTSSVVCSVAENPTQPILCLVFYTDSTYVTITEQTSTGTSKTISYTNTLVSAFVKDSSNNIVDCDVQLTNSNVIFSTAQSISLTYRIVTINNNQIGTFIHQGINIIPANITNMGIVSCEGYLINMLNSFINDNNNNEIILTDVELIGGTVVVRLDELYNKQIDCMVYYT